MGKASRRRKQSHAQTVEAKGSIPLTQRPKLLLLIITFIVLAPFATKAFNIDDPLFLWPAHQIAEHPLDPYGFNVNWYGHPQPMSTVMQNPPLTSYALSIAGGIFGWSEVPLHLTFALFAFGALAAAWSLGRQLSESPMLVALLTLATPAFLVSATSVMSDVPMLACFLGAIVFWIRGLNEERASTLWIASALSVAAGLFKYFGIALIPLLLAYAIARRKSVRLWLPQIVVQALAYGAFELWTRALYGHGLLSAAMTFASSQSSDRATTLAENLVILLSFAGGSIISALAFAPLLARGKQWLIAIAFALAAAVVFACGLTRHAIKVWLHVANDPSTIAHLIVFAASGLIILALAAWDLWSNRNADSLLIFLAVIGTCVFAGLVNWTIAVRSVLPLAPFTALLIARRLDRVGARRPFVIAATSISAAIALLVAAGDAQWANASRQAVNRIVEMYAGDGHTIWYEGHWGFQYYMSQTGANELEGGVSTVHLHDLWVTPLNNTARFATLPPHRIAATISIPLSLPVVVMSPPRLAGFYSDMFAGPLPYAFASPPPEQFVVKRLGRK